MADHNEACMSTTVANDSNYNAIGRYEQIQGTKYYVTGPHDAQKAIFFIYDIFGYRPQTLQGADILAKAGYIVFMPDLFDGSPAQLEWMGTFKHRPRLQGWMAEKISDSVESAKEVTRLTEQLKKEYPGIRAWGSIGYCWGGKLVALTSQAGSPWKVGIQSSPAKVDAADAAKITIPHMMLASKDEPADAVKAFDEALQVPKTVMTFRDQIHGWMSARADLESAEVKAEYERGYELALSFFEEHL